MPPYRLTPIPRSIYDIAKLGGCGCRSISGQVALDSGLGGVFAHFAQCGHPVSGPGIRPMGSYVQPGEPDGTRRSIHHI